MSVFAGLRCAMCKTEFPAEALYVCDQCLGPLEAYYDYEAARRTMTREAIANRPCNLWRYRELLPITGNPRTGFDSGWTPLVRAGRLGEALGVTELYIKDDSVNHPTLSYKDRVVPVAATRALELGFDTLGCASTGNLGNSVAAHSARLGLTCYVFIPQSLEPGKILGSAVAGPHVVGIDGTYDDVNRLCTQVGDRYGWAFANINLRSYYAEGAKTYTDPVEAAASLRRLGRETIVLSRGDGDLHLKIGDNAPARYEILEGITIEVPLAPTAMAATGDARGGGYPGGIIVLGGVVGGDENRAVLIDPSRVTMTPIEVPSATE